MGSEVVVTGAAGAIGRVAVERLVRDGHRVHAVDRRVEHRFPDAVTVHHVDVTKRGFDEILKRVRPDAVLHLARLRHFQRDAAERHRVNFEGTVHVVEKVLTHGVRKLIFPSRHTVYGALPDQPQFVTEDHPPMAGRRFPEIQDLVAADLHVSGVLWKHPDVDVVVLRPVNVIGPTVDTLFARYLSRPRVFTVAGFDPLYQVMHEEDLARAFSHALAPGLRGVFNVVGPGQVPLHVVIESSGAKQVAIPEPLIRVVMGRLGFPKIPKGAFDFLKYPLTIDGKRFREATGFESIHGLRDTLESLLSRRWK